MGPQLWDISRMPFARGTRLSHTQKGLLHMSSPSPQLVLVSLSKKKSLSQELGVERDQEGSCRQFLRWACCEDHRVGFGLCALDTVQGIGGYIGGVQGTVNHLKWPGQVGRELRGPPRLGGPGPEHQS